MGAADLSTCVVVMATIIAGSLSAQSRKTLPSDPIIEKAQSAASRFTDSLPKYLVKRTTTRYESPRPTCSASALMSNPDSCGSNAMQTWALLDVITADIVTENGQELDLNIKVNGKPTTAAELDREGGWSEGDFASMLAAILSPDSAAVFTKKHALTMEKRQAFRFDYSIDQPHSSWHLFAGGASFSPAYGGLIWFDAETSRVLRIEMSARDLPKSLDANKIEWSIDYDFARIGDEMFLLPKHSEMQSCQRDNSICSRNATDFQDYRKYSTDSSITFDEKPK